MLRRVKRRRLRRRKLRRRRKRRKRRLRLSSMEVLQLQHRPQRLQLSRSRLSLSSPLTLDESNFFGLEDVADLVCPEDMEEVERAVEAALGKTRQLCLMQCNTNYTGSLENFGNVNLNVLRAFALKYPGMPLGLSDHTPGHAAVLGAVALGACAVEKHFTDDNYRDGPDHPFSMNPVSWSDMVDRTRELELALGDGIKRIEANEVDSSIVQRRCMRLTKDIAAGEVLSETHLEALRPRPEGSVEPFEVDMVIGQPVKAALKKGDALMWEHVD